MPEITAAVAVISPTSGTVAPIVEYYLQDAWTATVPEEAGSYKVRAYVTTGDINLLPTVTGALNTDDEMQAGVVYETFVVKEKPLPPTPPIPETPEKPETPATPAKPPKEDSTTNSKPVLPPMAKPGLDSSNSASQDNSTTSNNSTANKENSLSSGGKTVSKEELMKQVENTVVQENSFISSNNTSIEEIVEKLFDKEKSKKLVEDFVASGVIDVKVINTDVDGNKVQAKVENAQMYISAILTPQELIKAAAGGNVQLVLEVSNLIKEGVPQKDMDALLKSMENGSLEGQYFDISLYKIFNNEQPQKLTEFAEPINVKLTIPKDMLKKTRVYQLILVHENQNGEQEILHLKDEDDDLETFSFSSDKLCSAAIVFNENNSLSLFSILALVALLLILMIICALILKRHMDKLKNIPKDIPKDIK